MSCTCRPFRRSKTYATIGADTDLVADGPGGVCARRILVGGAGTLVLLYADGTTDTITDLLAGAVLDGDVAKIIDSGTTASKLTAFW